MMNTKKIAGILAIAAMTGWMTFTAGSADSIHANTGEQSLAFENVDGQEDAWANEDDRPATYEEALFDDSYVHKVEITMEEGDWEDLLENALDKPKYKVTVTVDGETFEEVRFSPKGSSSLRNVAAYEFYKDRYSYKLKFNKYDKDRTYLGLDELLLNNSYRDPSCMRDVLAYDIFNRVGVYSPLTGYTQLYINGDYKGLYLAVESNTDSYLNRTLGGNGAFYMPEAGILLEANEDEKEKVKASGKSSELPVFGPPHIDSHYDTPGADLKYTDDDFDSYSDIFNHAETDITDEDKEQLIAALKALSDGDVENALDCNEVIRYFAAHNFITSWDSYTWKMLHNYGLYEKDGKLSMLPWDYNLAFVDEIPAVTGAEDVRESVITMDIDHPGFDGVTGADRPMWNWIVSDEKYREEYHALIETQILPYFESGEFVQDMQNRYEMIRPYLEEDPTYNYTMEEFDMAYQELNDFAEDRAASVREQIDGSRADAAAEDIGETAAGAAAEPAADSGTVTVAAARAGDVEMSYCRFGTGDKVFVILPGLSIKPVTDSAELIAQAFADFTDEYTVYLFDRRTNLPGTYSVDEMAEDTAAVMKSLGIEKADIFGASQGGMIAQSMAIYHPEIVDKIVLGSTAARTNETMKTVGGRWRKLAEEKNGYELNKALCRAIYSDSVYEAYKDVLLAAGDTITDEDMERFVILSSSIDTLDLYDQLDQISCEVLVLGCEGDQVTTADASREIAEKLGCEAYFYGTEYGHAVFDEAPDYRGRIREFLEK